MEKLNLFTTSRKVNKRLTDNYNWLVRRYCGETLLDFDNRFSDKSNLDKLKSLGKSSYNVFPVISIIYGKILNLSVTDDKESVYCLPSFSQKYHSKLIESYHNSIIYDSEMIRVNDWKITGNTLQLFTGRTTYFNSLMTNRAIDLELYSHTSLRDLYEPGPYIQELNKSKLSNHLGFCGFVETADGFFGFIHRSKYVSIGQNTVGCSVSASLKTKYCLKSNKELTRNGIYKGILCEINDEIKISEDNLINIQDSKCVIIGAFRDLVEGGKPQLLFYAKTKLKRREVIFNFNKFVSNSNSVLEDGKKILWIHINDLQKMCILPDALIIEGQCFTITPSHAASIIMLTKYLM